MPAIEDFRSVASESHTHDHRLTLEENQVKCQVHNEKVDRDNDYYAQNREVTRAFHEALRTKYGDTLYEDVFTANTRSGYESKMSRPDYPIEPLLLSRVKTLLKRFDAWETIETIYAAAKRHPNKTIYFKDRKGKLHTRRATKNFRHAVKNVLSESIYAYYWKDKNPYRQLREKSQKSALKAQTIVDVTESLKDLLAVNDPYLPDNAATSMTLLDAIQCIGNSRHDVDESPEGIARLKHALECVYGSEYVTEQLDNQNIGAQDVIPSNVLEQIIRQPVKRIEDLQLDDYLQDCGSALIRACVLYSPLVRSYLFGDQEQVSREDAKRIGWAIHDLNDLRISTSALPEGALIEWQRVQEDGEDEEQQALYRVWCNHVPAPNPVNAPQDADIVTDLEETDQRQLVSKMLEEPESGSYTTIEPFTRTYERSIDNLCRYANVRLGVERDLADPAELLPILKKLGPVVDWKESTGNPLANLQDDATLKDMVKSLWSASRAARDDRDKRILRHIAYRCHYKEAAAEVKRFQETFERDLIDWETNQQQKITLEVSGGVAAGVSDTVELGAYIGLKLEFGLTKANNNYRVYLDILPGVDVEAKVDSPFFKMKAKVHAEIGPENARYFPSIKAITDHYGAILFGLLAPDIKTLVGAAVTGIAQNKKNELEKKLLRNDAWLKTELLRKGVIQIGDRFPLPLHAPSDFITSDAVLSGLELGVDASIGFGSDSELGLSAGVSVFARTRDTTYKKHYSLLSTLRAHPEWIQAESRPAYFRTVLLNGSILDKGTIEALETGIAEARDDDDRERLSEYKTLIQSALQDIRYEFEDYCYRVNALKSGINSSREDDIRKLKRILEKQRGVKRSEGRAEYLRAVICTYAWLAHLYDDANVPFPYTPIEMRFRQWQEWFESVLTTPPFSIDTRKEEELLYIKQQTIGTGMEIGGRIYFALSSLEFETGDPDLIKKAKPNIGIDIKFLYREQSGDFNPDNNGETITLTIGLLGGKPAAWAGEIAAVLKKFIEREGDGLSFFIDGGQILLDADITALSSVIGGVDTDTYKLEAGGESVFGCEIKWIKCADNGYKLYSVGLVAENLKEIKGSISAPIGPAVDAKFRGRLSTSETKPIVEWFGTHTLKPYLTRYHGFRSWALEENKSPEDVTRNFLEEHKGNLKKLYASISGGHDNNAKQEFEKLQEKIDPKIQTPLTEDWEEMKAPLGNMFEADYEIYLDKVENSFHKKGEPKYGSDLFAAYLLKSDDEWRNYANEHKGAIAKIIKKLKTLEGERGFNAYAFALRHYCGSTDEAMSEYYDCGHALFEAATHLHGQAKMTDEGLEALRGFLALYKKKIGTTLGPWLVYAPDGLDTAKTLYAIEHNIYYRDGVNGAKRMNAKKTRKAWADYIDGTTGKRSNGELDAALEWLANESSGSRKYLDRIVWAMVPEEPQPGDGNNGGVVEIEEAPSSTADLIAVCKERITDADLSRDVRARALQALLDYRHLDNRSGLLRYGQAEQPH